MNLPFFKVMFKQQRNTVLKISGGIVLYEQLLTWVYPAISKTPAVTEIVDSFPSAVKTVFGVSANARTDTFEAYLCSQFFARIWTMLMALYGINSANALLSKLVEDGSLAFPLSAPISRSRVLTTQAAVLFVNNGLLITMTFLGLFLGTRVFGIMIDKTPYRHFFFLSLSFFSVISSYSLLFSTLAEKEKSLAYAYGLTFIFYVLDVLAGLSEQLSWMGNLSLFRLLKPQEVLEGTIKPTGIFIGLSLSACLLLYLAVRVFEKKDLPL
nr:ABC transporter permease subunit [Syntrophobotulus glycolicus]